MGSLAQFWPCLHRSFRHTLFGAMSGKSQELIQKLLTAEKQAEDMIASAKSKRLEKLKSAKVKAEEDLKVFKDEQEAKFEKEMGSKSRADPSSELKSATQTGVAMVNKDYDSNKAKTIEYVKSKVLDVPLGLTETQKQALVSGMA